MSEPKSVYETGAQYRERLEAEAAGPVISKPETLGNTARATKSIDVSAVAGPAVLKRPKAKAKPVTKGKVKARAKKASKPK